MSVTKADDGTPCETRWERLVSLYLILFLVGTETFLVSPLLPRIASDFAQSVAATAQIVSAYVLTYALLAPWLAGIADRLSRRWSIIAGLALFAAANLAAADAPHLSLLVAARALGGMGAALAGPAIWASIADLSPVVTRGKAVGFGMASFSLGQVAGVPAGGFIAASFGWRGAFAVIGVVSIAALALAAASLPHRPPPARATALGSWLASIFAPWVEAIPARALTTTFLFQAANLGAYTYLGTLLVRRFDFNVSQVGAIGIVVGLGSILGAVLAGRLGDLARRAGWSDASRLPVWSLLLAAALLIEGQATSAPLAVATVILWFVASGAFVTDQQTLLINALPSSRALGAAWNTSSMHAGTAVGVWTIGVAGLEHGLGSVAPVVAVIASAAAFWVSAALRRQVAQPDVTLAKKHADLAGGIS